MSRPIDRAGMARQMPKQTPPVTGKKRIEAFLTLVAIALTAIGGAALL